MTDFANLLTTMLFLHFLPIGFIVVGVYTNLPVGMKAYFLGQIVATGLVLDMIFSSVDSIMTGFRAYLALFQEGIMILGVALIGTACWVSFEFESTRGHGSLSASSVTDRVDTDRFARDPRSSLNRAVRVRGEVVVGLFVCSLIAARVVAFTFPMVPASGASLLSTPEVAVAESELFGDNYEFVVQLLKIVRLDLYLVIGLIGSLAMFPLGGLSPRNMKYSYLIFGTIAQVVILPALALAVFGLSVFGVTIFPPNAPADLVGNFSALAAPIFLLLLVGGAVMREFLRKAEHAYGS